MSPLANHYHCAARLAIGRFKTLARRCIITFGRHTLALPCRVSFWLPFGPHRRPGRMSAESSVSPFDDLPHPLHLIIVLALPLVDRVRCSLVSRRWRALLEEPVFWAELSFDGAVQWSIKRDTLLALCQRSRGALSLLDVTSEACALDIPASSTLPMPSRDHSLLLTLSEQGLCVNLRSLILRAPEDAAWREARYWDPIWDDTWGTECSAEIAASLMAACPALTRLDDELDGRLWDVADATRVLPAAGRRRLCIGLPEPPEGG